MIRKIFLIFSALTLLFYYLTGCCLGIKIGIKSHDWQTIIMSGCCAVMVLLCVFMIYKISLH